MSLFLVSFRMFDDVKKIWQKIPRQRCINPCPPVSSLTELWVGYKVGRVDQAETALGAEMRLAKDKKKSGAANDKIVRRYIRSSILFKTND
jgi:hypothetical protein